MPSLALVILIFLQTQPSTLSLIVGDQTIVVAAPASYVDGSQVFPDFFKEMQQMVKGGGRLLAWLIPESARGGRAADGIVRSLQVRLVTSSTPGHYDSATIASIGLEVRKQAGHLTDAQKSIDEGLETPTIELLKAAPRVERSLGVLDEGPDFVTAGSISSHAVGQDVSSHIVLTCHFLVRHKLLILWVYGGEASLAELAATSAILGEWRAAMRHANQ